MVRLGGGFWMVPILEVPGGVPGCSTKGEGDPRQPPGLETEKPLCLSLRAC